jgi:hypothetical protein
MTDEDEIELKFIQPAGAAHLVGFTPENPRINLITVTGLPDDFLRIKRSTSDTLVLARKAATTIRDGTYEITFRVAYDAYNDMNTNGSIIASGTLSSPLTATLTFELSPKSAAFPLWTLLAGLAVVAAVGGGWYLIRYLTHLSQVRAIRNRLNAPFNPSQPQQHTPPTSLGQS